ncbi:site-specific DNA-methyltransferase [Stenotrophomonas maltophilia]|uniref:site-specific DNA-methyltransferase n=1 Tax=Stenotrophomonas TaxID=40323 RepID=UPI00066C6289|nr:MULTISPECIES: site-specific DNA-methyltransferase [Stenotrophomonas]AWB77632.1 site-specific DNA-methyltransferase [Stenotrophomonas maltophilia]KOO75956.1 DNA methyltransferase [Stenotrophomonas maltophilia]MBH1583035.1 site-specific DNA-methyltransferase [Stenotrophomonas maltophilia]MBH1715187.1 site-specific DNA-methyltransferase [Stenotrophomonas maltophilia]MCR1817194.1 site-specific DNA-methyltransferase [Stenotrophomonas muris]
MKYEELPRSALIKLLQDHDAERAEAGKDGIVLNYTGRAAPWQIVRRVKPRMCELNKRATVGNAAEEVANELWDGENLAAMVTLYKYRGQVDLVLTDPPYNTGEDFRYNDKWDKDPNDPDMGELVAKDDGSRHSKWLRFMTPRLWMMREMLKPGGVIAICIDHRELYRLGMLMDEIFHEENRLGIINWQKASPKSQSTKVSLTTEYVLVYAKSAQLAKTGEVERTALSDARFGNIDRDPFSDWKQDNLTGKGKSRLADYAIQSPFTGLFHDPGERHWANKRSQMRAWAEEWGVKYEDMDIHDGRGKALALKGWSSATTKAAKENLISQASKKARKRLDEGAWPVLYWGNDGLQKPVKKVYKALVKQGAVPTTFWLEDDEAPTEVDSVSWLRKMSGRSRDGIEELDAVVGKGHNFETVKPLRLIKKIIQIWCRKDGIVLDPFAGSGTTGQAVLELNQEQEANRRFILIEQGNDAKGDNYAKTLTADRLKRVITGKWKSGDREPLGGGFRYFTLKREKVDANAVNALAREEMMDLLLVSYWDRNDKTKSYLQRLPVGEHKHLFAVNNRNEGFFLVWTAPDQPSTLTRAVFKEIVQEAKAAGLAGRYHVYASLAPYTGNDIEFYKIPDKVLEHIGFNARADAYNNEGGMDAD